MSVDYAQTIQKAITRGASDIEYAEGRQAWVDEALAALDALVAERNAAREALRKIAKLPVTVSVAQATAVACAALTNPPAPPSTPDHMRAGLLAARRRDET